MTTTSHAPRLLTREAAARFLGVPLPSFVRHVQPHVPCVRIGRRPMFDQNDLECWIEEQKRGADGERVQPPMRPRVSNVESPAVRAIREKLSRPRRTPIRAVNTEE